MIVKPESITFSDKKIRMLIYGTPGMGKTTLALSAPDPLYIDVDVSADRIDRDIFNQAKAAIYNCSYEEIRTDLGIGGTEMAIAKVRENLRDIKTIVVDTGGNLLTVMGQYGMKIDPKNGQRDGSLSLKGYGWLGREFRRFLDHIIYQLDKHIVIVFHTTEEKQGEETKIRIKAEGSSKNAVWEVIDLGCFMEIRGNQRTISFANCERYFAKGTHGINGIYGVPELGPGTPNDFLTKLFQDYNDRIVEESGRAAVEKEAYETAMVQGTAIIAKVTDADSANACMEAFREIPHALTSYKELGVLWNNKIKSLGLFFDKVLGKYTAAPVEKGEQ